MLRIGLGLGRNTGITGVGKSAMADQQ